MIPDGEPTGCIADEMVDNGPSAILLGSMPIGLNEKNMIRIGLLADCVGEIPTLITWFRDQWPDYYAGRSQAEMEQSFLSEARRDHLPIRLVAVESSETIGTIVLRDRGTESSPEFLPELGGLYVHEAHRGNGIGTELVRAGMSLARGQRYENVYATTVVAAAILERLGWEFVKEVTHQDGQLALYRCRL